MQALCRRDHDHAQWRVIGLRPAPRWMAYGKGEHDESGELGVIVEELASAEPGEAVLPDGTLVTTVNNRKFRVAWDVRPSSAPREGLDET